MQPPRVLLDASCLSDGRAQAGIGRYARELGAALTARTDIDARLVIPPTPPASESRPGRFLHAHPALLRAARRSRPHLVHGLGGEPLLGYPPDRQVVTVHDVEMWRESRTPGLRGLALRAYAAATLRMYRRCAAIIAVSDTTAEEAIVTLRLDASRVRVVPHGVSAAFGAQPAADDGATLTALGLASPYVLWSGSLRRPDPRKGLDTLLHAVAAVRRPVTLALAGATGAESQRVAGEARRLGVRARLLGSLDDAALAAVYRRALALVMPSLHEGFGLPMLEAMACGTPVVATSAGNLASLGHGAALFVPREDPQAIAAAIEALAADLSVVHRARDAGLHRAAAYTWARSAERTAQIYRELTRTG